MVIPFYLSKLDLYVQYFQIFVIMALSLQMKSYLSLNK